MVAARVLTPAQFGALGALLGLLVINRGEMERAGLIGTVGVVTVSLSLVLHSLSTAPGIRLLAAREASPRP